MLSCCSDAVYTRVYFNKRLMKRTLLTTLAWVHELAAYVLFKRTCESLREIKHPHPLKTNLRLHSTVPQHTTAIEGTTLISERRSASSVQTCHLSSSAQHQRRRRLPGLMHGCSAFCVVSCAFWRHVYEMLHCSPWLQAVQLQAV